MAMRRKKGFSKKDSILEPHQGSLSLSIKSHRDLGIGKVIGKQRPVKKSSSSHDCARGTVEQRLEVVATERATGSRSEDHGFLLQFCNCPGFIFGHSDHICFFQNSKNIAMESSKFPS
ncbi:hypothetical protein LIER_07244 [Lithospermum erythrorhizon]|uniref:Uncharacterized protein n=1 Tax=Lithospermum erythrorhizon TaxID=34254 RepID=A0AAV3P9C6_LITER